MTSLMLNKQFKPTLAKALVLFNQVNATKVDGTKTTTAQAVYVVEGNAPAAPIASFTVSKTMA